MLKRLMRFLLLATLLTSIAHAQQCTYETWDWDTVAKKSVNHRKVTKLKSELTKQERGEIEGCTVCEEDQAEVRFESLPPFKVCKNLEGKVQRAIQTARANSFPISSIIGYRVGKSKGPLNSSGQRTEFSNHSYGTAIDFNSEKNGLYDFCVKFGPNCRLLRGGVYQEKAPGAITRESPIYRAMMGEGFKWGGEISGKQKDFMHFSLTGM